MSAILSNGGIDSNDKECQCGDPLKSSPESLCKRCRAIRTAAMWYEIHNKKEEERANAAGQLSSGASQPYLSMLTHDYYSQHTQSRQQIYQQQYAAGSPLRYDSSAAYGQTMPFSEYRHSASTARYSNVSSQTPRTYGKMNARNTTAGQRSANYFRSHNNQASSFNPNYPKPYETQASGFNNNPESGATSSKHVHFHN